MKQILLAAIVVAVPFNVIAQNAQTPGGQGVQEYTNMCPTGVVNADGTFVVAPCGGNTTPTAVAPPLGSTQNFNVVVTQSRPSCPVNPISKIAPPLC